MIYLLTFCIKFPESFNAVKRALPKSKSKDLGVNTIFHFLSLDLGCINFLNPNILMCKVGIISPVSWDVS